MVSVPLEDLLNAVQVDRQRLGRHPHILDVSDRLSAAAQAVQARQHRLAQAPEACSTSASVAATSACRARRSTR